MNSSQTKTHIFVLEKRRSDEREKRVEKAIKTILQIFMIGKSNCCRNLLKENNKHSIYLYLYLDCLFILLLYLSFIFLYVTQASWKITKLRDFSSTKMSNFAST